MGEIVVTKGAKNLKTLTWEKGSNSTWGEVRLSTSTAKNGVPQYETFYNTAIQFSRFVESCDVKCELDDGVLVVCVVPVVANIAFSCELFLKSICTYKGVAWNKKKEGHSLVKLLKLAGLDTSFRTRMGGGNDYRKKMSQIDRAFESWRYEAEGPSLKVDYDWLLELQLFLQENVRSLRGEARWRESLRKQEENAGGSKD